jgi:hypothetical protein
MDFWHDWIFGRGGLGHGTERREHGQDAGQEEEEDERKGNRRIGGTTFFGRHGDFLIYVKHAGWRKAPPGGSDRVGKTRLRAPRVKRGRRGPAAKAVGDRSEVRRSRRLVPIGDEEFLRQVLKEGCPKGIGGCITM